MRDLRYQYYTAFHEAVDDNVIVDGKATQSGTQIGVTAMPEVRLPGQSAVLADNVQPDTIKFGLGRKAKLSRVRDINVGG